MTRDTVTSSANPGAPGIVEQPVEPDGITMLDAEYALTIAQVPTSGANMAPPAGESSTAPYDPVSTRTEAQWANRRIAELECQRDAAREALAEAIADARSNADERDALGTALESCVDYCEGIATPPPWMEQCRAVLASNRTHIPTSADSQSQEETNP